MLTDKEIEGKYKKLHDELSISYYAGTSGLTKEQFDLQHGKVCADMEVELIAGGFLPPIEPPVDWKAKWVGASTPDEKLAVIAERLELK